ncbi:hypothetical protein CA13_55190 [Planctomycetes bacterium CA13]|uniref:Uncharacterized protein n=1 Tax=Novipirellula herctigrandis TaxID=2527986 RepID=A0A5C5ZBU4_9BACT|nr:hypothetical protein CA13_55190 [Planctomycetes bacterium CA13]
MNRQLNPYDPSRTNDEEQPWLSRTGLAVLFLLGASVTLILFSNHLAIQKFRSLEGHPGELPHKLSDALRVPVLLERLGVLLGLVALLLFGFKVIQFYTRKNRNDERDKQDEI